MTTNKVSTRPAFNPYIIEDGQVIDIVFYKHDTQEIIGNTGNGWVCPHDRSNNDGNSVLEAIEYVRTTPAGVPKAMRAGKSFYVCLKGKQRRLYVSTADLPKFHHHGEDLATRTEDTEFYGNFISFEFAMPQLYNRLIDHANKWTDTIESMAGRSVRKIMLGRYTRTELTGYGCAVKAVENLLDPGLKEERSRYERHKFAQQLLTDIDHVCDVLQTLKPVSKAA
jgi:hypothetical protein